jgi:hypothetical protein
MIRLGSMTLSGGWFVSFHLGCGRRVLGYVDLAVKQNID